MSNSDLCLGRNGEVVIISDSHIGADSYAEPNLFETVDYIKKNKSKLILNGDIIENSIVSGSAPGEKLLEQKLVPTEQVKYAVDLFKPLAKQILFVTRGNHEARSRREALVDLSDILAHSLGVKYLGHGGIVSLRSGEQKYYAAVHHGSGFSTNTWRELDRMVSLYPQADLVAAGHDHNFCARDITSLVLNEQNEEEIRIVQQVRTGTYLKYADYARGRILTPTPVGSPIIHFEPKRHKVVVDVNTLRWY
jgi:predicted phosphodiesterase